MQIPDSSVPIERPCLYLVATPIGNLSDITLRALSVLTACDLILAEDTRTSRRLLDHYAIDRPITAVHEHNERDIAARLVRRITDERLAVALVSDAGTPLISDPGYPLMQAAVDAGLRCPSGARRKRGARGPVRVGTAQRSVCVRRISARQRQAARAALAELAQEPRTLIFFESPRRVRRTLATAGGKFRTDAGGGSRARTDQTARDGLPR